MNSTASQRAGNRRNRWLLIFGLVLLTVIGFVLRGAGAQSSIAYIPDTQIIREGLQMGQELAGERGALEAKYPFTLPGYLLVTYAGVLAVQYANGTIDSLRGFTDYLYANRETIHLVSVWSLNVINALLIPVIYFLAKRLNAKHSGWLAAGMAAFNLLLIHFGHHARPHVPLTTLSTLAILLLIYVAYNANWKWCAVAVIVSALTVGTLQNGVLIAAPVGFAFLARGFDTSGKFSLKRLFSLTNVLCVLLFAILSVILSPTILSEVLNLIQGAMTDPTGVVNLGEGSHAVTPSQFQLSAAPLFISFSFGYQPLLTLLFPFALAYLIWRLRRQIKLLAVLLPFWIGNIGLWALYEGSTPRVIAVTVPLFILAAAFMLEDVALFLAARLKVQQSAVLLPLSLLILIPTVVTAVRFVSVTAQTDTRSQATDWIVQDVPANTTIFTNFAALELPATRASLERQEATFPDSLGTHQRWLLDQPADTFPTLAFDVINNRIYSYPINGTAPVLEQPHMALLETASASYAELPAEIAFYMANGELIHTICPGIGIDYVFLPEDLIRTGWRDIWQVEYPGTITLIFNYEPSDQPLIMPLDWLNQIEGNPTLCSE